MDSDRVPGVVLSILLDDGGGQADRAEARDRVIELLDEPFNTVEAEAWRRERWGSTGATAAAAEETERVVAGQQGDFGDVDLDELRARRDAKQGGET